MTKEEKQKLRVKLEEMLKKSAEEIKELEELTQPIKPENSLGRISRMDAINNKSVAEAALRSKKKKIAQMKLALSNIDNTNFGLCESCNRPIQSARLIYMPESTKCVHCAGR